MKLVRLEIKNYRRIEYADIYFSPATFIIGANNHGKSSIIKCIESLLSLKDIVKPEDYRILPDKSKETTIEICGYFTDIDKATANSKGFKGRVIDGQYIYKKEFNITSNKPKIFTKQYEYALSEEFKDVKSWQDLLDKGFTNEELCELLGQSSPPKGNKLPKDWELNIENAVEWDLESEPKDVENPGGIPSVVVSKLPRVVHIPSYTDVNDIGKADGNTVIGECLGILFEDLLSNNELAAGIQNQLNELQQVMSPHTQGSMTDTICQEINKVIGDVFPNCGINIDPSLKDLASVLKPKYEVKLFSNVDTEPERQGTGLVRTTIFSMLRYHSNLKIKGNLNTRPLLVAFEEPELYLHPSAANLLRDTIYLLGLSDQIVCTTHSPWMIDLSKDWQSLTKIALNGDYTYAINYGLSQAAQVLEGDEHERIKMIKTFDDDINLL